MFIPNNSTVLKLQTAKDLQGDALLHYDAETELMNLMLLAILNDIYNSVDACTSAKDMWKRVERLMRGTLAKDMWKRVKRLMRGTIQNKVDRETQTGSEYSKNGGAGTLVIVEENNRRAMSGGILVEGFEKMLQMRLEMFKGLFEPRLQEILQLFNATTAVEKDIMLGIVQSQEFGTRILHGTNAAGKTG
ncbi:hypothetical protein Tco_0295849 [Tanacetum coccineum]